MKCTNCRKDCGTSPKCPNCGTWVTKADLKKLSKVGLLREYLALQQETTRLRSDLERFERERLLQVQ